MTKYKGCNYCRYFRGDGTCRAFDPGLISSRTEMALPVKVYIADR